jgi:hypothetical protein
VSERSVRDWPGLAALVCIGLAPAALAVPSPASAYFTANSGGTLTAGVASLTRPAISQAKAAAGGTVSLTWAAAGGPGPVAYYVTRDGGAAGGTCPSAGEPENEATSCVDAGLEPGTYTYKVTARYRTWTATGEPVSATITIGPASHFVLTVSAATVAAAASDNLTMVAKDAHGSTVTTYTGSHSLTFEGASPSPAATKPSVANSSGTATAFGTATAINFTNGTATVNGTTRNGVMKLYRAGPTTISVSDGSIESEVDPTVTVTPLAMSKLALAAATTAPTAGVEDAMTVTAQDAYGNTAITYSGSHSLKYSGPVASPSGQMPTVTDSAGNEVAIGSLTPTEFLEGVAVASEGDNGAMRLYKAAAAASVKVAEGTITSAAVSITAGPASAASLSLAPSTKTPIAGSTDSLKTTALDAYGNTATSYTGVHPIVFSGPEASPSGTAATVVDTNGTAVAVGTPTSLTFAAGVAAVASSKNGVLKPARSGAATLSASEGTIATAAASELVVAPGSAARFAWAAPAIGAGILGSPCLFTCAVTGIGNLGTFTAKVAVTDSLGNVVSNLGTGHAVTVSATAGSTVTGGSLTIAAAGPAESETTFTYTSKASGTVTDTITAARSLGTTYTSATATTR